MSAEVLGYLNLLSKVDGKDRIQGAEGLVKALASEEAKIDFFSHGKGDAEYVLNRLFKGLLSSSICARQGFALALTRVLKRFDHTVCRTDKVLQAAKMIIRKQKASSSRQEKREYSLARLALVQVLIRSGRLKYIPATVLSGLCVEIVGYASVREVRLFVFSTLLDLYSGASGSAERGVIKEAIRGAFEAKKNEMSGDHVYLALALAQLETKKPKNSRKKGKKSASADEMKLDLLGGLLQPKNLKKFCDLLAETIRPSEVPHPVWRFIVSTLPDHQNKTMVSITDVWSYLCETHFCNPKSTLPNRRLCFQAFCSFVSNAPTIPRGLFHPLFAKTLLRALSCKNALTPPANSLIKALVSAAQRDSKIAEMTLDWMLGERKGEGDIESVQSLSQLISGGGTLLTALVGSLDSTAAKHHFDYLIRLMESSATEATRVTQSEDPPNSVEAVTKARDKRQLLFASQVEPLYLSCGVIRSLEALVSYAFFRPNTKTKSKSMAGGVMGLAKAVKVSDGVRNQLRIRVFSLLSQKCDKEKKEFKEIKGKSSYVEVLENILEFSIRVETGGSVTLCANTRKSERKEALNQRSSILEISKSISKFIKKKRSKPSENNTVQVKLSSLQVYMLVLAVVQLEAPVEVSGLLGDLIMCVKSLHHILTSKKKKKVKVTSSNQMAPHLLVLTEVILGSLVFSYSAVREAARGAFRAFSSDFTSEPLQGIISLIQSSPPQGGEGEEEEDENDAIVAAAAKMATQKPITIGMGDFLQAEGVDEEDLKDMDEESSNNDDEEEESDSDEMSEEEGDEIENPNSELSAEAKEMQMYTVQLERMMKMRKEQRKARKDMKRQAIHFRVRALELVDLYISSNPTSVHVLSLLPPLLTVATRQTSSKGMESLSKRATSILRGRFSKAPSKGMEGSEMVEVSRASGELIFQLAHSKSTSGPSLRLASLCVVYIGRLFIRSEDNDGIEWLSKKITSSLHKYMTGRKASLNYAFFSHLIEGLPALCPPLISSILPLTKSQPSSPTGCRNAFLRGECCLLLTAAVKTCCHLAKDGDIRSLLDINALLDTAKVLATPESTFKKDARIKSAMRYIVGLVSLFKLTLGENWEEKLKPKNKKKKSEIIAALKKLGGYRKTIRGVVSNALSALGGGKLSKERKEESKVDVDNDEKEEMNAFDGLGDDDEDEDDVFIDGDDDENEEEEDMDLEEREETKRKPEKRAKAEKRPKKQKKKRKRSTSERGGRKKKKVTVS
ncbi:hypothetical protein AAMO2058_000628500 [Amorphochlora amoebiformis]